MNKLTQIVMEQTIAGKIDVKIGTELLKILKLEENKPASDDIAIIGIALQFPQAKNKAEFWTNLQDGVDAVGEYPHSRRPDTEAFVPYTYFKDRELRYSEGGYLEEIDQFDYSFFRLTPKEASLLDPHQRLFLQTAWEAIEDAGYGGKCLVGSSTGVYVGYNGWPIYGQFIPQMDPESVGISTAGNLSSIIASRISYLLNLRGPALTVDTACSSSLVAVHLAAQAIKTGECEMALAGGVKVNLLPLDGSTDIGIESSSNRTKSFDDSSDGTVWGEGVAVLVLKPLKKAQKDRDNIYAVIKGSAVNQDGASIGITAPNMVAQTEVIEQAWAAAGIEPETISYVEAHGTGTKLGDPIEIDALTRAFRKHTDRKQFCAIGSVKSNIGHLDNVAGLSGLIKAILALKHKQLPSTLHFEKPNRKIQFENSPLYVQDRLTDWDTEGHPRRCGVSSFGMSGTNCHVVLEEAPVAEAVAEATAGVHLFTLSAKTRQGLQRLVGQYADLLQQQPELTLEGICGTANVGRGHYEHRLGLLAATRAELAQQVSDLAQAGAPDGADVLYGVHRLVADDKEVKQPGEVSELDRRNLSAKAQAVLETLVSGERTPELMNELGRLYIQGADVAWERLYPPGTYGKSTLPTYPFEGKRCWVEEQHHADTHIAAEDEEFDEFGHTLVGRLVFERPTQEIYSSTFSVDRLWILGEHKIAGSSVIPGTTYLELARAAALSHFPNSDISLDLWFVSPLVAQEGESYEVQSVLDYDENGQVVISIASRPQRRMGEGEWVKHAEGKIGPRTGEQPAAYDVTALKAKAQRVDFVGDPNGTRGSMEFGPRWFSLRDVYRWGNELLGFHELADEFVRDLEAYYLHPALMDLAVNIDTPSASQYLPLGYKKMHIYGPTPQRFYAYIRRKQADQTGQETLSYQISLLDESGNVFVEIEEYMIKKVRETELRARVLQQKELFYELGWTERTRMPAEPNSPGNVLVLADAQGVSERLRQHLEATGQQVVEVRYGTEYRKLGEHLYEVGGPEEQYQRLAEALDDFSPHTIFHLFALDAERLVDSLDALNGTQARGFYSLFHLARTLLRRKKGHNVRVLAVGQNVYEITGRETAIQPETATLFGLGKVVDKEFPHLSVLCVDTDDLTDLDSLLAESNAQWGHQQVAIREGRRYVLEFRRVEVDAMEPAPLQLREDGVYVITGGTGGLGLEVAKSFAERANVNFALLNRSSLPPRQEWETILKRGAEPGLAAKLTNLLALEQLGSKVSCHAVNVASEADMQALFRELRTEYGKINGIVHAAGVAGDGFVLLKEEQVLREVLAPKVEGTWLLHHETQFDALDFFVNFSSVASLICTVGQSDYAAGNSYLDAMAAYRNRLGQRTLSINWPAWKETGMAVDYGVNDDRGAFKALGNADALAGLHVALDKRISNLSIGELNYSFLKRFEGSIGVEISASIKQKIQQQTSQTATSDEHRQLILKGKAEAELSKVEWKIARIWSQVLGVQELDVYDSFYEIGGDSILAMKLHKKLDEEFPGILDISDLFSYATIIKLAQFVESRLHPQMEEAPAVELYESLEEDDLDSLLDRLESGELSVDDIDNIIKNS